jgi:hypothetical protein
MKPNLPSAFSCGLIFLSGAMLSGQPTENPAMNAPDQVAWQLFIRVNAAAGGSNALFETWASDTDTFKANPQFPSTPSPLTI